MKRTCYFDLLRCTCFCLIFFIICSFSFYLSGICPVERLNSLFSNSIMHLVNFWCCCIFMLSGASLSYTAKETPASQNIISSGHFWRILIPFLYFILFISCFLQSHSVHTFSPGRNPSGELFTFLEMDSWVSMHGISIFSLPSENVLWMSYSCCILDLSIA